WNAVDAPLLSCPYLIHKGGICLVSTNGCPVRPRLFQALAYPDRGLCHSAHLQRRSAAAAAARPTHQFDQTVRRRPLDGITRGTTRHSVGGKGAVRLLRRSITILRTDWQPEDHLPTLRRLRGIMPASWPAAGRGTELSLCCIVRRGGHLDMRA